jgi:hypothetical protein
MIAEVVEVRCLLYACSYDINITPDKRKAMFHSEQSVLETFQQVSIPRPSALLASNNPALPTPHLLSPAHCTFCVQ